MRHSCWQRSPSAISVIPPWSLLSAGRDAPQSRAIVDVAGRHASAAVGATAEDDFTIQRNGTSIATMRFAAAATTASFIAASETVLEPGDVLSVTAPATPDATLAAPGFTLAGVLIA